MLRIQQHVPLPKHPRPIVIVGAGGIVRSAHLPAYKKAGFPVAGIFDVAGEKALAVAQEFSIPAVYSSLDELFARAPKEAVFDIATPASCFLSVLGRVPEGSVVLLQKPMGENIEQATAIRDLCRRRALTGAVNFQLRYAPNIMAARSLIERGAVGEVSDLEVRVTVYTPWHLWSFLEGIPRVEMLYHSVHYIDLARSFLGDPPTVWARTVKQPKNPKIASTRSNIILEFGPTVRANISVNHDHEYGFRHQESYVKWEGTGGAIKTTLGVLMDYPNGVADTLEYCTLEEGRTPEWTSVPLEGTWFPDGFTGSMASLMRYADGSSDKLPNSIEDAWRTMSVVEAAYRSSDSEGTRVRYD